MNLLKAYRPLPYFVLPQGFFVIQYLSSIQNIWGLR